MISDTDGDNATVTRGELLCILRVMEKMHYHETSFEHLITPVCVYPPVTN